VDKLGLTRGNRCDSLSNNAKRALSLVAGAVAQEGASLIMTRERVRLIAWGLMAAALWTGAAQARPPGTGERFARRACAGCHAVGVAGPSRHPLAPPFRSLSERYPGRALTDELNVISAHGHRAMPPIYMTPAERRAVAAYIRSVAARSRQRAA
jgi:cytochrome c